MTDCRTIMAVTVSKRVAEATKVQQTLTTHGCIINLRIGLHEVGNVCADNGLILLNLCGTKKEVAALKSALAKIKGVKVKTIQM